MSTSAYFDKEAQKALVDGLTLVAKGISQSLGPCGHTAVIQMENGAPKITKDGVSIAKEIKPKNEKVKLGADLAISIAQKQVDNCGDGTTTATVLGHALVTNGLRQMELCESNVNVTSMAKGLEKAKDYVISELEKLGKEVSSKEELINIATISANNDRKIGEIVASAYDKVGKDGAVVVEETKDRDVKLEFKEGMTFDRGWTSQFFVTNHESQTVEYDNPKILLCNSKISNFANLVELIQPIAMKGDPVVVIAESFDSSVTQGLAVNIVRSGGQLKVACVEAPGFGDRRLDILRDMGIYLGCDVADDPMGMKFETFTPSSLGSCDKIIIRKNETVIRGGHGDEERIAQRIEAIKGLIGALKENDTYDREKLVQRLSSLTNGIAVIKVGGSSDVQIKTMKDQIEDTTYAVKAALEEGYLPGGGNTLLMLSEKVKTLKGDNADEQLGIHIFANAMKVPFKAILENAGVNVDTIMNEVLSKNDINIGYDAKNLKVVNLIESGILDPVKVVKGTVYAATSIASVILTSNVIICTDPEENKGLNLNMMSPMM